MITLEEAIQITNEAVKIFDTETIDTLSSIGRVLAEDIISDMDMPPFDKSAMDGYACKYEDLTNELEVIELIQAGKKPNKRVEKNQCSKIMTGAVIPEGADCVIMLEHIMGIGENKIKYARDIKYKSIDELKIKDKRILNICYKGEDIQTGEIIIKKGKIIKPQHIAMMAAVGYTKVKVGILPKIAVIPTGDEIVEPNLKPSSSEIRNSNGYQLIAQLARMGIIADYYGIARDTEDKTIKLIEKACQNNDIIIMTGGVSMGDFDLVPDILNKLNFEILFQEISVQPGKPSIFARKGNKYCFGLPGNPVSGFIQFEVIIKPFLYRLMGHKCTPVVISFPLAADFSRKSFNRMAFYPVSINKQGEAELIEYHGSAHINAFNLAWGVMEVPLGVTKISKGEKVNVRQV
jgi:molybdopterin molybdotransferase